MPYTEAEKQAIRQKYGWPSDWEVVPTDEYYASQSEQPAMVPSLEPRSTALGAAYRGAKRSLIPSLAGILGTAGTAALMGPGTQPLAGVLLPLAAGLGAGFGASAIQEKVSPTTPEEAAQRQADVEEHPIASVAGELVPGLAAMKPSLGNVKSAFTKLPKGGVSQADDAVRAQILSQRLNVGLGGALGAVSEVGVPLATGEDISPLRAAGAIAGGALLNEPNKIGRMLGFKPSGPLRPSPTLKPRVGYDSPIGPAPDGPHGPGFFVHPEHGPMSPEAYEAFLRQGSGQNVPRGTQPEEPSVRVGSEDVEVDTYVKPGDGDVRIGEPSEPVIESPEVFQERFQREQKIAQMEQDIAQLEVQIRHLPMQERLQKQAVLNEASAALAREKINLAAERQAEKVVFVAPDGQNVSPKPALVPPKTPTEAVAREEVVVKKKRSTSAKSAKPRIVDGWTEHPEVQYGSFKHDDPNLTPEMKAALPKMREFTDRRPDTPTPGMSVYVPDGSDLKTIKAAIAAKTKAVEDAKASKAPPAKEAAIQQSAIRMSLRQELGLNAEEVTKLLKAKTPFDRGMNLLVALQRRGIKTQVLEHTPEGHRVAVEQALHEAAAKVKMITGQEVSFKAGVDDGPEIQHQLESELAKAPLEILLSHPNNREVFDLLEAIGMREGIEVTVEPSLMTPEKAVALGAAWIQRRVVQLNASLLAEDTLAHELAHILLRDLINQDDPLAMRGLALFKGDEERLVQALGTRMNELGHMRVEGLTAKRFVEWVKDLVAAFKNFWNKASEDDFRRLLARRMMRGNDYQPARIVVTDKDEVRYQTLANNQQDNRDSMEAALAARTIAVEHGVPGLRGVADRVRREVNQELGDALANVDMESARYRGRFTNKAQAGVETLTKAEQEEALRFAYDVLDNNGNPTFVPSDKVLDWWENSYRPFFRDVAAAHREVGKKIIENGEGREIFEVPWYSPQILREDIQDLLLNHPNDPKAIEYRDKIVDHIAAARGITREEAFGVWETRGRAEHVGGQEGMLEYGPLSKEAGIGLPAEVRENDLNRLVTRYGNRAAAALSWHKHIVSSPSAAYLAGVPDQFGNPYPKPSTLPANVQPYGRVPIVAEAIKILKGDFSPSDRFFDSFSRGVKVMMMQTLTGAADLTTWWAQVLPYMHPSRLGNIASAVMNVSKGIKDGLAMGVIQKHAMRMQSVVEGGESKGVSRWITRFNKLADAVNTITGRDGLERVTRGLTMVLGEMEATANIAHAFNPASPKGLRDHAWRFLDNFADKDWARTIGDLVSSGQPVPDEVIQRIAANLVDAAQGTYSIRGLPLSALKGEVSPFLSLAKWNIEKANNFQKHVIAPLLKGDITPFLMTTAGGLIGGAAVEQLREWMTRRKGAQATWEEIAEAGGKGFMYKAMAMSSFSGYGGIVTELAKQGMDAVEGRPVTGFRFPAVAFIADTVERGSQAFHAVKQGENLIETFGVQFPLQMMQDHIQMARIGLHWTVKREEVDKSNQLRDLRTFRELRGLPTSRWTGQGKNPFLSQTEREFERTTDPSQAVTMAGQLRRQALERGRTESGSLDLERVRSLINSYRAPATDVMPSMRNNPQQFRQYLEWIKQTKGEAAAQELLQQYLQKERMDRLKMGLLPSL